MCGPQIKKYIDIGTSSSLNIKVTCTRKEQEDANDKNSFPSSSSSSNYVLGGLSINPFVSSKSDYERRMELHDEATSRDTDTINKESFDQQYYEVTDDLLTLSRSLHALEDRSEILSDSLLYTCNVAAEAKQPSEVTNSHKRTLEDVSSLPTIDLQSSSRPKRAKRAKRNVYSPSSSSSNQDEKVEKPSTKKRAGRKKKRKGAPSRPLSAYNFFFKQERMRLINLSSDHPKIGFSSMGKIIGTNWKSLSEEAKAPYKALADKDHERYARELEIFEEKERMAAGTYDDTNFASMIDSAPLLTTTSSTDTFKTQEEIVYEEPYSSSSTSSTNSTSTITQQEDLQNQEATNYDAFQDILIQDIEPIPLNEVWKPNNYGYKAFQNEALYGYVNFGDFLNNEVLESY